MDDRKRLKELVQSANRCAMRDAPLKVRECRLVLDRGWTHILEVVARGFYLVEVRNTGWGISPTLEAAMMSIESEES